MIDLPQTIAQRAATAFDAGDLATADSLISRLLASHPSFSPAWILRARVRMRQSKYGEAEAAVDQARKLSPSDPEVPHTLALIRMRQSRPAEALPLLEKVQALDPSNNSARIARARCLVRLGEPRQGLMMLGTPSTSDAALAAAEACLALGEESTAEGHLQTAIALRGNAAAISQANALLGELFERRGDYEGALRAWGQAKRYAAVRFDPAAARDAVETLMQVLDAKFFESAPRPTLLTKRPVFIVGMPRSGTTLLEKMIASHPEGAGAGETDALTKQVRAWNDPKVPENSWPRIMRGMTAERLDSLVRGYLSATETYAGRDVLRIADKHLQNWYHLGLIAVAFPEAAIIHIQRDPMDTGLSCFQRLPPNAMPWSSDLRNIGLTMGLHGKLMDHWHRVLPGRIHSVRYEDLVRQTEQTLRPVLAAIGLEWNDACARPHERKPRKGAHEPLPSLAAEQVAKPIYTTSIGRAAKFGNLLDPLRQAYEDASR